MNENDFDIDLDDIDDSMSDLVAETRSSRFLTKDNIGEPNAQVDLTILKAGRMMTDFNDGKGVHPETIIVWKERGWKPFIVRPVNCSLVKAVLGTADPKKWAGCRIGLKHDPTVMMAGQLKGGIRVCHPSQPKNGGRLRRRTQLPGQRKPEPEPEPDEESII